MFNTKGNQKPTASNKKKGSAQDSFFSKLPFVKRKPVTFGDKIRAMKKKADKKAKKYTKKIIYAKANNKKRYYRQIVLAPRIMDFTISVLFVLVVFVLFFIKAKHPNFLEGFFSEEI